MVFNKMSLYLTLLTISVMIFFGSCVSRKSSAYFQNDTQGGFPNFDPVLQANDHLSIHVSAPNQELFDLFNPFSGKSGDGKSVGEDATGGYTIDSKGNIEFPVIGTITLANLKKEEAAQLLKEKLKVYLKEPLININITNYRVTVLGDVKSPGSFLVPSGKISFVEALGMAGDLNITALRNNILLIRNFNGQKKTYRVDMTRQDIFHSADLCYLRQGDIIYVEPNRSQRNSGAINSKIGILLSITTVILTSISLLTR